MFAGDFFFVVVGDGGAFVHLAEAVHGARIEEEGCGQLRFARTAVPDESHVPDVGCVIDLHDWYPPGPQGPRRIISNSEFGIRSSESIRSSEFGGTAERRKAKG